LQFIEGYWNHRYLSGETGWDLGEVSPPLKAYFDQLEDKTLKILIPGGGNSHEAEYLYRNGFKNVYVCDIATVPLRNLKERIPEFPEEQLLHLNFFDLEDDYDLVVEQTFFCAINPEERTSYIEQIRKLLKPNGKLVGLLFNVPLNKDRPPFGGSQDEYKELFASQFEIDIMETAFNSIAPRAGNELFVKLLPLKNRAV
jgi:SAM-dependent methyltransferase